MEQERYYEIDSNHSMVIIEGEEYSVSDKVLELLIALSIEKDRLQNGIDRYIYPNRLN